MWEICGVGMFSSILQLLCKELIRYILVVHNFFRKCAIWRSLTICLTNQPGYFFKCSIFPFLIHCAQDFVEAGANIVITNTYQCNLEEFGNDQNAFKEFINDAVEVAKLSGAEVVAGSIGPYGAKYKDGTSYTGIYNDIPIGMDEKEFLKKWHLPRIQCLIKNGVDILAFETCPKLIEGLAFSELIQELQFPGFICFQCR